MSVINTMLKDLEKRKAESSYMSEDDVLKDLGAINNNEKFSKKSINPYLLGIASFMSLIFILLISYILLPYRLTNVSIAGVQNDTYQAEEAVPIKSSSIDTKKENEVDLVSTVVNNPTVKTSPELAASLPQSMPAVAEELKVNALVNIEKQSQSETAENVLAAKTALEEPKELLQVIVQNVKSQSQGDVAKDSTQLDLESDEEPLLVFNKKQPVLTVEQRSQKKYQTALSLYKKGEIQHSSILLSEVLNVSPEHMEARHLLAIIHLKNGRLELAKEVVSTGLLTQKYDQNLLRLYLQICVQEGNYSEAIVRMETSGFVSSPEDKAYLAGLYQKTEDHSKAFELYSQALTSRPDQAVWWMGKAISLEALRKNDEALQAYKTAASFNRLTPSLKIFVISRIGIIERMQVNTDAKQAKKKS